MRFHAPITATPVYEDYDDHQSSQFTRPSINKSYSSSLLRQASLKQASHNNEKLKDFLTEYKWPIGLQDTFIKNINKVPIRFFICDDSGSVSNYNVN